MRMTHLHLPAGFSVRLQLRNLLFAGASSAPTGPVNETYFEGLRERVRGAAKVAGKMRSRS